MKELQSFLGTANWLREYVPNFARIAAPLTDILGKKKFTWTHDAVAAFEELKRALERPLTLCRPDPELPFTLQTDASSRGMGAVLFQTDANGQRRIISCASAKFNKAERKYHCNEQEVLAALWGCKRYRALLEDRPFVLKTDSRALQWLNKYQDNRAKLTRWALLLQEYNFTVEHCPGKDNQLPDYLSRNPEDVHGSEDIDEERLLPPDDVALPSARLVERETSKPSIADIIINNAVHQTPTLYEKRRRRHPRRRRRPQVFQTDQEVANTTITAKRTTKFRHPSTIPNVFKKTIRIHQVEVENPEPLSLYEQIAQAQQQSIEFRDTRVRWHRLRNGQEEARQPWQRTFLNDYVVEDNLIWYTKNNNKTLVVPQNFWRRVIYEYHDSEMAGHPGRDETLQAIRRLYYWSMSKYVKKHVRSCLICAATKRGGALQPAAPLRPHPPRRPWQTISIDIMGPYPESRKGNKFLLVATDLYSKWIELEAIPQAQARPVVNFLQNICQRWGYPEETITDNGPVFRGATWEQFHGKNHIALYTTPIYHQRSNPVERRNQEVKKLLRVRQRNQPENRWDEDLNQIMFILHNRTNAATGVTPSEALLGAPLVRPGEWQHPEVQREVDNTKTARERRLQRIQERQAIYTRNLFPFPRNAPKYYNVGDQVLVRTFSGTQTPFGAPWSGPHPIIAVRGDGTYEVDRNGSQHLVHIDDLRPVSRDPPQDDAPEDDDDTPEDDDDTPENDDDAPEDDEEPPPQIEPQPGPSSRPPDPREFAPRPTNRLTLPPHDDRSRPSGPTRPRVTVEDIPDDPGDPGEARTAPGLVPIVGLYP